MSHVSGLLIDCTRSPECSQITERCALHLARCTCALVDGILFNTFNEKSWLVPRKLKLATTSGVVPSSHEIEELWWRLKLHLALVFLCGKFVGPFTNREPLRCKRCSSAILWTAAEFVTSGFFPNFFFHFRTAPLDPTLPYNPILSRIYI